MNKIYIRIIILIAIFLSCIFTFGCKNTYSSLHSNSSGGYTMDTRADMACYNNIYCIEHNDNWGDNGDNNPTYYTYNEENDKYVYSSNSSSAFKRAVACILKYGFDHKVSGYGTAPRKNRKWSMGA